MQTDKKLPEGFKTWTQLYRELKKESLMNEETISFHSMSNIGRNTDAVSESYSYATDYIKARCFDEIKDAAFNMSEIDCIMYALRGMRAIQSGDPLDTKLHDYIENLYALGEYQ